MYAAPGPYGGAMPGLPSAWDVERRKQIDRTKTGLLLLLIGGLVSWVAVIRVFGGALFLLRAVLRFLRRETVRAPHSRHDVLGIAGVVCGGFPCVIGRGLF